MPDQDYPPRWRAVLRITRAVLYTCVIAAGVGGLVWQPITIAGTIGEPLTVWWTLLAALGGLACLIAVVAGKWKVEAVAAWPTVGGLFGYALAVWGIVFTEASPTRTAQAFVVSGLMVAIAHEGLRLAAHAAKLRLMTFRRRSRG